MNLKKFVPRFEKLVFKNPIDANTQEISAFIWLWVFVLNFIYFAVKKIWKHAVIGIIILALAIGIFVFTDSSFSFVIVGISWIVYPFFAKSIITSYYVKKGWIEVNSKGQKIQENNSK